MESHERNSCALDYGSHRGRQADPRHRPPRRDPGRPRRRDRQSLDRRLRRASPTPGTTTDGRRRPTRSSSPSRTRRRRTRCSSRRSRRSTRARSRSTATPCSRRARTWPSGAALDALRAGTLKPVIWTPSSSLWGRLLTQTADVTWVPRQNVVAVPHAARDRDVGGRRRGRSAGRRSSSAGPTSWPRRRTRRAGRSTATRSGGRSGSATPTPTSRPPACRPSPPSTTRPPARPRA